MSAFQHDFIAVGSTFGSTDEKQRGVVIASANFGTIFMNEAGARKLADDLLREANYLWPIQEESK